MNIEDRFVKNLQEGTLKGLVQWKNEATRDGWWAEVHGIEIGVYSRGLIISMRDTGNLPTEPFEIHNCPDTQKLWGVIQSVGGNVSIARASFRLEAQIEGRIAPPVSP
jgi:hypothetical protein